VPKYSMVSFHRIPYRIALERGNIQDMILRTLCATISSAEELDWQLASDLIRSRLTPFHDVQEIED